MRRRTKRISCMGRYCCGLCVCQCGILNLCQRCAHLTLIRRTKVRRRSYRSKSQLALVAIVSDVVCFSNRSTTQPESRAESLLPPCPPVTRYDNKNRADDTLDKPEKESSDHDRLEVETKRCTSFSCQSVISIEVRQGDRALTGEQYDRRP